MIMITRPFAKADIRACTDMFINVFNREPWNDRWTLALAVEYFQDVMNTPGFEGFVIEAEDSKIVGFVIGARKKWWSGDIYYLYEMCVDEAYQEKGIGTKLMDAAKIRLMEKGYTAIVLLTERTFPSASFYKKQGFIETSEIRFYFCSL